MGWWAARLAGVQRAYQLGITVLPGTDTDAPEVSLPWELEFFADGRELAIFNVGGTIYAIVFQNPNETGELRVWDNLLYVILPRHGAIWAVRGGMATVCCRLPVHLPVERIQSLEGGRQ